MLKCKDILLNDSSLSAALNNKADRGKVGEYVSPSAGPAGGKPTVVDALVALNDALTVKDDTVISTVEEINAVLKSHEYQLGLKVDREDVGELAAVADLKTTVGTYEAPQQGPAAGQETISAAVASINSKWVTTVDGHTASLANITTTTNKLGNIDVSSLKSTVDGHTANISSLKSVTDTVGTYAGIGIGPASGASTIVEALAAVNQGLVPSYSPPKAPNAGNLFALLSDPKRIASYPMTFTMCVSMTDKNTFDNSIIHNEYTGLNGFRICVTNGRIGFAYKQIGYIYTRDLCDAQAHLVSCRISDAGSQILVDGVVEVSAAWPASATPSAITNPLPKPFFQVQGRALYYALWASVDNHDMTPRSDKLIIAGGFTGTDTFSWYPFTQHQLALAIDRGNHDTILSRKLGLYATPSTGPAANKTTIAEAVAALNSVPVGSYATPTTGPAANKTTIAEAVAALNSVPIGTYATPTTGPAANKTTIAEAVAALNSVPIGTYATPTTGPAANKTTIAEAVAALNSVPIGTYATPTTGPAANKTTIAEAVAALNSVPVGTYATPTTGPAAYKATMAEAIAALNDYVDKLTAAVELLVDRLE
ncbi:hypothetical protein GHT06_003859 [Daphnia sinensis]|uniref:Uncharacterized protein n=1 Tax=Daphnia sinensis TaxID=1820382 RepID=A0AAD5PLJ8_9CRUS|nr:hypothetical protein GHT06_003859 [Daphnia sinensis]